MFVIDANILIYAHDKSSNKYNAAKSWLEKTLNGSQLVGLPWASINAFLRIITNKKIIPKPIDYKQAISLVTNMLDTPKSTILVESPTHWSVFSKLITTSQAKGNLIPDAHLAPDFDTFFGKGLISLSLFSSLGTTIYVKL